MIHHTCRYSDSRENVPLIDGRMTSVVMDYAGRYRCPECKRRVKMDNLDRRTWKNDLKMLPRIEPPYKEGASMTCPECGSDLLIPQSGCSVCQVCGYSPCEGGRR